MLFRSLGSGNREGARKLISVYWEKQIGDFSTEFETTVREPLNLARFGIEVGFPNFENKSWVVLLRILRFEVRLTAKGFGH